MERVRDRAAGHQRSPQADARAGRARTVIRVRLRRMRSRRRQFGELRQLSGRQMPPKKRHQRNVETGDEAGLGRGGVLQAEGLEHVAAEEEYARQSGLRRQAAARGWAREIRLRKMKAKATAAAAKRRVRNRSVETSASACFTSTKVAPQIRLIATRLRSTIQPAGRCCWSSTVPGELPAAGSFGVGADRQQQESVSRMRLRPSSRPSG